MYPGLSALEWMLWGALNSLNIGKRTWKLLKCNAPLTPHTFERSTPAYAGSDADGIEIRERQAQRACLYEEIKRRVPAEPNSPTHPTSGAAGYHGWVDELDGTYMYKQTDDVADICRHPSFQKVGNKACFAKTGASHRPHYFKNMDMFGRDH